MIKLFSFWRRRIARREEKTISRPAKLLNVCVMIQQPAEHACMCEPNFISLPWLLLADDPSCAAKYSMHIRTYARV